MIEAFQVQAEACASLGSKMYAELLQAMNVDYQHGGITHRLLYNVTERPIHDATPLRFLGALHRIALSGRNKTLSRHYESVGGTPTASLVEDVLVAIDDHFDEIAIALHQQVQTNEPGRALCHLALSHWLAHLGLTSFQLLEVGASAGLTMSFDRYGATSPLGVVGDSSSPLQLPTSWLDHSFPFHDSPAECVGRRGVDISPIDASTSDGTNTLLSFVWPDQHERLQRLRTAIELTNLHPHQIDQASVDTWLPDRIDASTDVPVMVFHSIVWQYLGTHVQRAMQDVLHTHGCKRTAESPLIWARMEPAGRVADIQATIWAGSTSPQNWKLATIGYHGQSLRWNPQRV